VVIAGGARVMTDKLATVMPRIVQLLRKKPNNNGEKIWHANVAGPPDFQKSKKRMAPPVMPNTLLQLMVGSRRIRSFYGVKALLDCP
jgi:hypothetical protein